MLRQITATLFRGEGGEANLLVETEVKFVAVL